MPAININNINLGLNAVQNVTDKLKEVSTFTYVDPDFIHYSADNPYSDNDTVEEIHDLALSIDALGLINPITLNKKSDTEYILISGEKRFKAITTHLHWKSIPATVFEGISDEKAQLMLHEANLAVRQYTNEEKLTYYQKAKVYVELLISKGEYKGGRQKKIANMLGVTTRQIRTYDTITENLSDSDIEKVKSGNMSINEAYNKATEIKKSGSTSATADDSNSNVPDGGFITEINEDFRRSELEQFVKFYYADESTYEFYTFNAPTTAEGCKRLKPFGGYAHNSSYKLGNWTLTNKNIVHTPRKRTTKPFSIIYTYSEVDKLIRELIVFGDFVEEETIRNVLWKKLSTLGRQHENH